MSQNEKFFEKNFQVEIEKILKKKTRAVSIKTNCPGFYNERGGSKISIWKIYKSSLSNSQAKTIYITDIKLD
jgi:hypothetical protein